MLTQIFFYVITYLERRVRDTVCLFTQDRMCVNFSTKVLRFKVRLRQVRGYGRKTKSPKTYSVMCSST